MYLKENSGIVFLNFKSLKVHNIDLYRWVYWLWPVEYRSPPPKWLCKVSGRWQELEPAVTCLVSMQLCKNWNVSASRHCVRNGAVHYHPAVWGDGDGWISGRWAWRSSRYLCTFKLPLIKCTHVRCLMPVHTISPPPRASLFTTASCSTTERHNRCQPSTRYSANRESSVKRTLLWNTPSKVSICPLELVTPMYCSQVKISTQLSFSEVVSDYLCWNSTSVQTSCFIVRLGGWTQTISQLKTPGVTFLGWHGLAWSAASRPVGCTP